MSPTVRGGKKNTIPDQERDMKSIYISLKGGWRLGGKGKKKEGVDSGIRRMFYFCRIWAGISSRSGLNASLSHYKDKYIIERETDVLDDRCVIQTRVQTFETI